MNYLLVTHIPFAYNEQGEAVVDGLWARDLIGLARANGPIRVVAPQLKSAAALQAWGPNTVALPASANITFAGFPSIESGREPWKWLRARAVLRKQVHWADVVHTSNVFPPYMGLSYAHDLAVKAGKKTVFVIAEDFHDMLSWEWIRPARGLQRRVRERTLRALDRRVRRSAATASLTLIHTPAAVARYRLAASNSYAIRQPGHELDQVILETALETRLQRLNHSRPLHLVTACRHSGLKGLDLLIRAVALLERRNVPITVELIGQGPETAKLQQLSAELGVAASVVFAGSLPAGPALDAALRSADLFVMPHRTTDFGRAFFDAMAAGLPVLAFRTPASVDTVYDGLDGFLAPLDDVQGLAEKIALLHAEREHLATASRHSRRRAMENTRSEWFRIRSEWTRSLLPHAVTPEAAEELKHAA